MFNQDYFELFGLERGFDLDPDLLIHRYRDLQKTFHPDKFANATEQERRIALQQAALINTAYQTLKDPLGRARYLLELAGVQQAGEQQTIRDPEFLEEQMELREALQELPEEADPQGAIFQFLADLNTREKRCVSELGGCFAKGDEAALEQARVLLHRLQFVRRLQQEAEAVEEELL